MADIYKYYVYSSTIVRSDKTNCEVSFKDHKTGSWEHITNPYLWRDALSNGQEVSEKDANKIYEIFHKEMYQEAEAKKQQSG